MEKKPSFALRLVAAAVTTTLVIDPIVFAQAQQPGRRRAARGRHGVREAGASGKTFSQQDLDEVLAPIALYPDALLAQVFMASTYPLEVVEAARWQKANPTLKDKALEAALEKESWDPSVKALTAVPQVLTMMNEKLDWTTKLGDAFLASQEDILKTVQALRKKADQAGNLKDSKEMSVKKETENNVQIIKIEQPDPQTVYVPTYNPATVYGSWWYPYPPPYYYYPPGYAYGAGLAFASGVFWGAAIAGGIGWGNNEININRNTNINTGNRNNIQGGNKWQHNPEHRKGAAYRDSGTRRSTTAAATAPRRNRVSSSAAVPSRDARRWARWTAASCRRPTARLRSNARPAATAQAAVATGAAAASPAVTGVAAATPAVTAGAEDRAAAAAVSRAPAAAAHRRGRPVRAAARAAVVAEAAVAVVAVVADSRNLPET
jgi:hypothetical protein